MIYAYDPNIKSFQVRSAQDRVRYHNQIERIRTKHQRVMRSQLRNCFNLQKHAILNMDGDITMHDVEQIMYDTYPAFYKVFRYTYLAVGDDVYPMTVKTQDIGRSWRPIYVRSADEWDSELPYRIALDTWIKQECGNKIREIDNTTLRQVKKCYEKASNQDEFRQMMRELFDNSITPFRSNAIARTETAMATNRCSVETMRSTGFTGQKIWMAVGDMDTRDTHILLDGRTVGMEDKFRFIGQKGGQVIMDCPADSSFGAPPEEVINCRCDIGYEF